MVVVSPVPPGSRIDGRTGRTWLGVAGFGWALSYIPIHVWWALGGVNPSIGIVASSSTWQAANWGASLVILGAGLTCLALVRPWGRLLPRALRHGTAWLGGLAGIAHCVAFSTVTVLRLAGVIGLPAGSGLSVRQVHNYDWANLLYFEPWFGIMGVVLIACTVRVRRQARAAATGDARFGTTPSAPDLARHAGWARPASLALLGLAALAHLLWAAGSGVLIFTGAGHSVPRLIDVQVGPVRPVAAAVAVGLAGLCAAVLRRSPAGQRRGAAVLMLAGLSAVLWGVFTFDAWTFAGYGPVLIATGMITQLAGEQSR